MIITKLMLAVYLEESGWKLEARGAWKNPRTHLSGYTLLAALQSQLIHDEGPSKAKGAVK